MSEIIKTEAVECCPHCNSENSFPNYDVKKNGFIATCHECGKQMFLCDECMHSEDNPRQECDWRYEHGFSRCFRGEYREGQKKAVDIQWDCEPEDLADLPTEIILPEDCDFEDDEAISDFLSDETGFCHKGFRLEDC